LQLDNEAVSAPKLNIMPVEKTHGLVDCLGIVGKSQRFKRSYLQGQPIIEVGFCDDLFSPRSPELPTGLRGLAFAYRRRA
jgi:hypothetical protein